jgi:hypothetical protein
MRVLNSSSLALFALALLALTVDNTVQAFVKGGVAPTRVRPASVFELSAVAKKAKKVKKVATKKGAAKKKVAVDTIRKPDFVASVAEKLDCTKTEADAALAAVLETISEVSH